MKNIIVVAIAAGTLALSGCASAQASGEATARMGESMEIDGIKATITQHSRSCWDLEIENTRWLRSVKAEEGGVVRAYAGVQDSIIYLAQGEGSSATSDFNWGDLAPIKRGESRHALLCQYSDFSPDRVQIDIADSTIEFS